MTPQLIAISGSTREGSWNQKLLSLAAKLAREAGAEVTEIDLKEYDLPLFSEDLEAAGVPESVTALKRKAIASDGYLIASPEYNGSISPLLKNTIDWLSRQHGDEEHMAAYRGKVAAVMAASPGGLGGIRALPHVRTILQGIGTLVIPEVVTLGSAHKAFDDDGSLKDGDQQAQVKAMAEALVSTVTRLKASG